MTREALNARLQSLLVGKEQLLANIHATEGAIAECEYWLAQLPETDERDDAESQ